MARLLSVTPGAKRILISREARWRRIITKASVIIFERTEIPARELIKIVEQTWSGAFFDGDRSPLSCISVNRI